MTDQMIDLRLSRRDVGRLLSGVRHRRHKLEKGLEKFKGNFDATLGKSMLEGQRAFANLDQVLTEAMQDENDHPRRAGRNPREHEGRRDTPGDHRPAG